MTKRDKRVGRKIALILRLKHDWKPVFTNRKMEKCVKSCTDLYDLSFLLNRKSNPIALCHINPQKSLILDKH